MASANISTTSRLPRPKIRPIPPRSSSSYDSNASAKRRLDRSLLLERMGQGSVAVVEQPSRNRKRGRSELYNDTDDERALYPKTIKSSENGGSFSQGLTGSFRQEDDDDEDVDDVMKDSIFSDVNYRRNCGSTAEEEEQRQQDELDNRGGKRRLLDVVGSVVGAVWEFCKSQAPALSLGLSSRFMVPSGQEYFDTPYNMPPEMFQNGQPQTMPGALPEYEMFIQPVASPAPVGGITSTATTATPPQSPASSGNLRKHRPPALSNIGSPTSKAPSGRGMSGSWVLVNEEAPASTVTASAASRASAASTRQSQGIRPSTPMYTTSFPVMVKRNGTYARTVPRKSRPFSRPLMPFGGANKFNPIHDEIGSSRSSSASAPSSPVKNSGRASGASEASFRGSAKRQPLNGMFAADFVPNLPSGNDLKSTPSLRRNPEVDTDESIRKFNKRLKDMIREGKEALGTTVEVYDCVEDWDVDAPRLGSTSKIGTTATVWR